jgi:hypothetical protein
LGAIVGKVRAFSEIPSPIVEVGLLLPHGERRGRHYTAGPALLRARSAIVAERHPRDDTDPFNG